MFVDKNDNVCLGMADEVIIFNKKRNQRLTFTFQTNSSLNKDLTQLFKLKNSKILALCRQDAVLVNFKNLASPSFNDQLYIHRIGTADTIININEKNTVVKLRKNQNSFAIYYGILMPSKTSIYSYYYQLEGFDNDWREDPNGLNFVSYGNLEGGEYIFKVKAKDKNGKFLPTQTLFVHIETPFYKALWFKILGLLFISILVFAFIRFRANQRKKIHHLQLQSTRLEKDKTEIQYQNLINHLNPHFLFNSLTSLNSLIMTEPKTASKFLQKLSAIYRYILQSKDKEVVTLDQELSFVKNYIELQKSRFEEGIDFRIDVPDEYLSSGIVPVTLQNLFENAIKHNTIEEDKPLFISVLIDKDYLIVKNNLQRKKFVETSNKQGLDSLKKLYNYLSPNALQTIETESEFIVRVPLI
ncbi:MAG: hypothetical protein EAZ32_13090 [Cytophagia bacterium]|nr:MAG: hypothetical protein EAZ38_17650 [Cytophagales bacterium]TAG38173.1 MAG: hypothetical protein EAZ32_13090 [Cytophagia bacterium]